MLTRTRSRPARSAGLLLALALVLSAGCLAKEEQSLFDRTNALRASQGIAPLKEQDKLNAKAEWWANYLASQGSLQHSTLSAGLDGLAWQNLAENVAVSSPTKDTMLTIYNMLASSSSHRANMLDRRFTHIGVGVARSADGRYWVVQEFADL